MSKLLFLYENNSPSAELTKRLYESWKEICSPESKIIYRNDATISEYDVNWADVLIIVRGLNCFEERICKLAQKRGVFVILHIDDDMLSPPNGYIQLSSRTKALAGIIKIADAVITNPYLKDKYAMINRKQRTILLDSPIEDSSIYIKKQSNTIKKIVYPAGKDHAILFEKYIVPALNALPKDIKTKIEVDCIGNKPNVDLLDGVTVNFIPQMSLEKYEQHMKEQNYDIGLAPLDITEFCKGKYYNKFISFAQYGIVGLYTNVEPYNYIVKNEETGFLCNNDWHDWAESIKRAVENNQMLENIRDNQYELLKNRFNSKGIIEKYNQDIPELKQNISLPIRIKIGCATKIGRMMFSLKEKLYFVLIHLRQDGVKETIKRIKNHYQAQRNYGEL